MSQATADLETGFSAAGARSKEVATDPEGQGSKYVPKTLVLDLIGKGGQSKKLCDFMQGMQKGNVELHAACVARKAACAKSLLEVGALRIEKLLKRKELKS